VLLSEKRKHLLFLNELTRAVAGKADFEVALEHHAAGGGDGDIEAGGCGHTEVASTIVDHLSFFSGEIQRIELGGIGGGDIDVAGGTCHGDSTCTGHRNIDILASETGEVHIAGVVHLEGEGVGLQATPAGAFERVGFHFHFGGGEVVDVAGHVVRHGNLNSATTNHILHIYLEIAGGGHLEATGFQVGDVALTFSSQREVHLVGRDAVGGDVTFALELQLVEHGGGEGDGDGVVGREAGLLFNVDVEGLALHLGDDVGQQVRLGLYHDFGGDGVVEFDVEVGGDDHLLEFGDDTGVLFQVLVAGNVGSADGCKSAECDK